MSKDVLLIEKTGNVAILTLNRPEKLNALSGDLQNSYREALAEARDDDDVRVVIITGAGRGFCSGADLTAGPREQHTPTQNQHLDDFGWVGRQATSFYGLDKPIIAAVNADRYLQGQPAPRRPGLRADGQLPEGPLRLQPE